MEDTVIINLYFDRSEKAIQATEEKYSRYCFSIAWNVLYDKEDSNECKLRSNGMPVPLLRNGYSIFNGTKYR